MHAEQVHTVQEGKGTAAIPSTAVGRSIVNGNAAGSSCAGASIHVPQETLRPISKYITFVKHIDGTPADLAWVWFPGGPNQEWKRWPRCMVGEGSLWGWIYDTQS